tara:strand:- start:5192 stop:6031 length:840 start_codon:yes stop_codon:yes gene_type:complete
MVQLHIDLDTPHILNRFYGGSEECNAPDDEYCQELLQRAGAFFDRCEAKATFFIVTSDLQLTGYAALLKEFARKGHEMASHTHSHPYFHCKSPVNLMRDEIKTSYEAIHRHFGRPPSGFRAPGFYINDSMISILRETGYRYDSSSFRAPLMKLLDLGAQLLGAPTNYSRIPHLGSMPEGIKEFSIPNFFGLPFYNNLNLYYPRLFQNWLVTLGVRKKCSPYLFHLIEFVEFEKDRKFLPKAIWQHPNLKRPLKQKLEFAENLIARFKKEGPVVLARNCA